MIAHETRQAILTLKKQGLPLREIARILKVSRNTVKTVIRQPEPGIHRENVHHKDLIQLLPELFRRCRGNAVRVQELLQEEYQTDVPYSTLTRLVRDEELRQPKRRAGAYHFEPGEEMQHDTSPHRITLGDKTVTAQCAALALAYSRRLFIQYYPAFTRFKAKVFLRDAFQFMDGTCPRCVIDNTSVMVASGSGPDAQIAPEMEAFGHIFGVHFHPHRIGHADRKARVERPFDYVERNFLAGRTFRDWDDLNRKARQWCVEIANQKPKRALGMSPEAAYVMEKTRLILLPPHIPPVYQSHDRCVSVDAFVTLNTNSYSVPERLIGKQVEVHKHPDRVLVLFQGHVVADHARMIGKRHGKVTAKGHHAPFAKQRAHSGPSEEERQLTGRNLLLDRYVAGLKKRSHGRGIQKLRRLLHMKRDYPSQPFMAAVEQAFQYGLYDLARLEEMILKRVAGDFFNLDDA